EKPVLSICKATAEIETSEQPLEMETDEVEGIPAPAIPREPPKIHRLDESVVNRIAAGEVIQRPVSAIKELVENSLDAGSTSINVVVKDGGLKLIQVSDDGHGIRYEDLPILCERHTTSKLSAFEDLQSIKSMGFRGEALASMTYVGHVTVTTITKGQLHGYRASYRDGVMEHEPKPCAAVKGTQIMIENLFYNMIARRKTLQSSADDYPKVVDMLSRFAVHHTSVSFSCRKHGAARADVHSVPVSSRIDAIRSVYGVSVACNLITIEASDDDPSSSVFQMDGFISSANYFAKKITMVLFINGTFTRACNLLGLEENAKALKKWKKRNNKVKNLWSEISLLDLKEAIPEARMSFVMSIQELTMEGNSLLSVLVRVGKNLSKDLGAEDRLVDCGVLKRAIEIVYAATLPKASKPFIYMSIVLPPDHVDVNIHPTKREHILYLHKSKIEMMADDFEVSLLNQEVIIEKIQSAVESKLRNFNEARTFQEQVVFERLLYTFDYLLVQIKSFLQSKQNGFPIGLLLKHALVFDLSCADYDFGHFIIIISNLTSPLLCFLSLIGPKSQKVPVHKMVRTDALDPAGRLHAYLKVKPPSDLERHSALTSVSVWTLKVDIKSGPEHNGLSFRVKIQAKITKIHSRSEPKPPRWRFWLRSGVDLGGGDAELVGFVDGRSSVRQRRNPKETADLTSIQELINDIDSSCHSGLLDIVRNCTYIGMADDVYALLQHNTHLYLANIINLSKELMYQQVLRRFAHFTAIQLSDPAPLPELIMLALKEEDLNPEGNEDDDLKEKIAEMNTELLKQKAEMLEEYFSIHVDSKGNLSRLPIILDQYTPDMDCVPEFVLCLGNDVDWENEKNCFQSIAAALGNFYAMSPPLLPNPSGDGLEFYKRTVPSISPEDADNPSITKGTNFCCCQHFTSINVNCGLRSCCYTA
ncbi:hypothetical protein RJ639_013445, partial [Escallonia herrerae]